MTPEEHKMITDLQAEVKRLGGVVDDLHRALLAKGPDGSDPFLVRTSRVVQAAESGSWGIKWIVRIIMTIGGLIVALSAIKGGLK